MERLRVGGEFGGRVVAALGRWPEAVVCRASAAWLWGLDVLPPGVPVAGWPVELMVSPGGEVPHGDGVRGEVDDVPGGVLVRQGVAVTTPVRTAVDCGRFLPRFPAMAALDAFAREVVSRERLCGVYARLPRAAGGRRQVGELLRLVDPRVASPGESWTRLLIADGLLPVPAPQVRLASPGHRFFVDLGYRAYRVGIEYDGEAHHEPGGYREHDLWRRARIRAAGWELLVVRRSELWSCPHDVLRSVLELLLVNGWRPTPRRLLAIERRIRRFAVRELRPWVTRRAG